MGKLPRGIPELTDALLAHDLWSRRRLLAHQRKLLHATLEHAATHSSYYRETLGPALARGSPFTDLPTIHKKTLVESLDRLVTDPRLSVAAIEAHLALGGTADLLLGEYRICATGGTTGVRALMVYDRAAWALATANSLRFMAAIAATPETRTALIGSPTPLHLPLACSPRCGRRDRASPSST